MTKLATLFTDSYREFRYVKTITTAAMFGAISVVLGYFSIEIGSFIKIGFSTIANQFVYYLFGPVFGCVFGGALDILKYLIKPTGEFFPGFTLTAMVGGLIYGFFFYKKPITLVRVLIAEFTVCLVCNVLMSTLWLSMLYGKGFMVLLPMRALKNLIMWPINSMLFYTVAKAMEASGIFRVLKNEK
ncbi:MAG: folate family ECF transporter S component [Brotaphodocola sp.]